MLGMCKRNGLKHTNESQFYVTTGAPLTFLDSQNVVFGRVIQGMRAFKLVEKLETTNEKPNDPVKISKAGAYKKWTSRFAVLFKCFLKTVKVFKFRLQI